MEHQTPVQALAESVGITTAQLGIAILITEPGLSLSEIARRLQVPRGRLYRDEAFAKAWRLYRCPDVELPRSAVRSDGGRGEQFEEI